VCVCVVCVCVFVCLGVCVCVYVCVLLCLCVCVCVCVCACALYSKFTYRVWVLALVEFISITLSKHLSHCLIEVHFSVHFRCKHLGCKHDLLCWFHLQKSMTCPFWPLQPQRHNYNHKLKLKHEQKRQHKRKHKHIRASTVPWQRDCPRLVPILARDATDRWSALTHHVTHIKRTCIWSYAQVAHGGCHD